MSVSSDRKQKSLQLQQKMDDEKVEKLFQEWVLKVKQLIDKEPTDNFGLYNRFAVICSDGALYTSRQALKVVERIKEEFHSTKLGFDYCGQKEEADYCGCRSMMVSWDKEYDYSPKKKGRWF